MPFAEILADWLPLTYALNALNRSMGSADLYPFLLPPPVVDKLDPRRRAGCGISARD